MRGKCGNRKYSHILTKSRMILNTIVLNSLSLLKLRSSLCRMLLHKRLHKNLRKSRMLLLLFILLDSLIVLVHYKVLIISISSIMKINIKHVPLISQNLLSNLIKLMIIIKIIIIIILMISSFLLLIILIVILKRI